MALAQSDEVVAHLLNLQDGPDSLLLAESAPVSAGTGNEKPKRSKASLDELLGQLSPPLQTLYNLDGREQAKVYGKMEDEALQRLTALGVRERLTLDCRPVDFHPHLGSSSLQDVTWSVVSGFKGLENDVVIVAGLTDIETDWHRRVAYVGMSRARTRLDVVIHEECAEKRREREEQWRERVDSHVEMLL